eukprot:TRINITY_DN12271_c0_g1_i1.p1 TRINITY_DN12271_c0_g1~~TRINITY_DN12271_c0_g1_i1.p1  ORF type:complete len:786 (+),score=172.92 TRINITY_DN12271_c0_g1_i1:169-2526(+)
MRGRSLDVEVRQREVTLAPGMDCAQCPRNWPSAPAPPLRLEKLEVKVHVDVFWPAPADRPDAPKKKIHSIAVPLAPQGGARLNLGGPAGDAENWLPIMLMGELPVSLDLEDAQADSAGDAPSGAQRSNVLRGTCRHQWEEEPPAVEQEEHEKAAGTPVEPLTGEASYCLSGFASRAQLDITATLYLAPGGAVTSACSRVGRHTLVVSGSGTLKLQPRLVDFRRLGLSRLLSAASEDTKRGDNAAGLQKWRYALPLQERRARNATTNAAEEMAKLASLLHHMGVTHNVLSNSLEALACLRRALKIRQVLHGEEHADSARTLQALGVLRVRDGEYHEAFEYFWQALRYYEAFDPDSLEAANTFQAMAGVYGKLGELSEAFECYVRALSIREQALGRDHTEVAATLHNLGVVLEKLSDHRESLDTLHRALAIRERRLGAGHPQTARTLHSIGIVYSQLLDYTSALTFYKRALTICQKRPSEGTHAAATLNNMGVVYAKLGNRDLALQHHEEALALQEKLLGPDHADTQATRWNLQVLRTEAEQSAKRSFFDQIKGLLALAANDGHDGQPAPSLITLLCEESNDPDGPTDEPPCRGAFSCCSAGGGGSSGSRPNVSQRSTSGPLQSPTGEPSSWPALLADRSSSKTDSAAAPPASFGELTKGSARLGVPQRRPPERRYPAPPGVPETPQRLPSAASGAAAAGGQVDQATPEKAAAARKGKSDHGRGSGGPGAASASNGASSGEDAAHRCGELAGKGAVASGRRPAADQHPPVVEEAFSGGPVDETRKSL